MLIDTHCHLDEYSEEELKTILDHMKDHVMIISGVNASTNKRVLELCHQYNNIYGVIGIHPEELDSAKEEDFVQIEEMLSYPKIVGVGEIGLDYHYTKDNIEKQKEIFIRQIELAKKYHKPIVIHSREAIQDTYDILCQYRNDSLQFVLHAYSGSVEMAKKFINLGVKFGIGGVVTFKNAGRIKEVVETFPLDYFLLETDSPYLTPEPYRGQRNKPYHVKLVAEKIAEIKNVNVKTVIEKTTKNACTVFSLPIMEENK